MEIGAKKILIPRLEGPSSEVSVWEKFGWEVPLPPSLPLSKAARGTGFAKMACKILSPKGLEVKILTTKNLGCSRAILFVPLTPW